MAVCRRFIPVGTGNTHWVVNVGEPGKPVHPRGYGEHTIIIKPFSCNSGSSPWVRGTPRRTSLQWPSLRFIPVGTGNTPFIVMLLALNTVHPRGYGEHGSHRVSKRQPPGSSPWVRGTQVHRKASTRNGRFIPVGTGNTSSVLMGGVGVTVHPRGYGEHAHTLELPWRNNGSSPWVRGTPALLGVLSLILRFIPVGTGNTNTICLDGCAQSVHPRGYGEH